MYQVTDMGMKHIYNKSSNFGSTTQYNMRRKPLGLIWLFRPSTAEIIILDKTTSITFKYAVDKLEQNRTEARKKLPEKAQ